MPLFVSDLTNSRIIKFSYNPPRKGSLINWDAERISNKYAANPISVK